MKAARETKAAERLASEAEERADRIPQRGTPAAQKKERGRSENLDPEIEA